VKKRPGTSIVLRPATARRGFSMENALGGGATGDPLASPREIRIPQEGVRMLGLPDVPHDGPPLGPGSKDGGSNKSRKRKGADGKSPGSGGDAHGDEKLGWFDVTVVDAWGEPVGGIELEVSYQGTRKKVRTAPNGNVRIEGVDSSFGSVRFVDVAAARDVVRPRWVKGQPESSPTVGNPEIVALAPDMASVSLTSEVPRTIVLVRPLPRVRLIGMHFDTKKSFMRPTAVRGIRAVVSSFEKSPTGKLLIVGHTDSVGRDSDNLGLSVDRAEAVKAYLKNDVHAWEVWFDKPENDTTRWGERERTQMISALPCKQTVAGFQAFSNETRGTALAVDGKFGPATRKALIEAYMELGGTTLPDHIGIAVHGCGEFFPAEDVGDDAEDEENRRVEMFCFDDEITPPVPAKKAKKGEVEYPQWSKQVTKEIDVTTEDVDTLFVTVFAPLESEDETKQNRRRELLICDALGTIVRVRPEEEGVRNGDNLTFDLDPSMMPNPTQLKMRRGLKESAIGEPIDPKSTARELRAGVVDGATTGGAGTTVLAAGPSAGAAPTKPSVVVEVSWRNATHRLLKTLKVGLASTSPPPAVTPAITSTVTTVGSKGRITFVVDSHDADLALSIEVPDPDPLQPPILLFTQGLHVTTLVAGAGGGPPVTGAHFIERKRAKTRAIHSATGLTTKFAVELDLDFLDVTAHVRASKKNPSLDMFVPAASVKSRLVILEHTGGHPATWAIAIPQSVVTSRSSLNAYLFFTNEMTMHWEDKKQLVGAYFDCEDADYVRLMSILNTPEKGKYVYSTTKALRPDVSDIYPQQGWDDQLHQAGKPVIMVMPLPHGTDFGAMSSADPRGVKVLHDALRALWYEDIVAMDANHPDDVSLARLAIGGWSSGTNTLIRWIVEDAPAINIADEVYFFDGVDMTVWPGSAAPAIALPTAKRDFATWLSLKADRRLMLVGTSYTQKPALDDFRILSTGPLASQVSILPSDKADYYYTDLDYANALCAKSRGEQLSLVKPIGGGGVLAVDDPAVNGTQATGVFVADFPDPAKVATAKNRPSPTDVLANQLLRTEVAFEDTSVAPPRIVTDSIPRASLAEASFLIRYFALKVHIDNPTIRPTITLPLANSERFHELIARVHDLPPKTPEPNWTGRLRHAWSVMGGTGKGNLFKGHLQICLEKSAFT
jgi:outer membrane protein OmpA-like peptidoglycan-associated protein